MDTHIANDPNNPINWNGKNAECNTCGETLDSFFDYENICNECFQAEQDNIENEFTCCNIEITDDIKDIGRCPKCLENIS